VNPTDLDALEKEIEGLRSRLRDLRAEIAHAFLGHEDLVENVLSVLLAGGHALIEGVPGLGKTVLVKTIARALDLRFSRIQFTPDLMPADVTGTNILVEDERGRRGFRFQAGPIFGHVVLADEINRATPKTQSALLEAMQEHGITVAGERHVLEEPFLVLATQNPIEMEGTYPLPEAQIDRFLFKLRIHPPGVDDLVRILDLTTGASDADVRAVLGREEVLRLRRFVREIPIAAHLKRLAALVVSLTSPVSTDAPASVRRFVRYGSSPRGAQALVLGGKARALFAGRYNVSEEDLLAVALPALRHRLILNFEGEAEGVDPDDLVREAVALGRKRG
jgi:MoxR-like ATPase